MTTIVNKWILKSVASFLLMLFSICSVIHILPYVQYGVAQGIFEAKCENQDKPILNCHGKCARDKMSAQMFENVGTHLEIALPLSVDFAYEAVIHQNAINAFFSQTEQTLHSQGLTLLSRVLEPPYKPRIV